MRRVVHRGRLLTGIAATLVAAPLVVGPAAPAQAAVSITWERVASGLSQPTQVTSARDGSGRLFVVEKQGTVRVFRNGRLLSRSYLDIRDRVRDAYRVEARIVVWEGDDVLKVPAGSLFRHEGGWAVYVVEGGAAALRLVEIGHNNGLEAEVLSGLSESDEVILHPGDKIKPGVAVVSRKDQ